LRFRYSAEDNGRPVKKAAVYTQDEHRINFADVDPQAVYITDRLQANGYETYIVGGAVRDLILGKKPKDFDIASSASPAKIKKVFRNARIIGRRFRLVHVYFGPKIFEVSTFRSLKDGPTSNTFGTIEDDVQRRDFTLNALFYDPLKQLVVDYVDGMKDIRNRTIRPIIALPDIFTDDPVRMIRAVKYGALVDFKLPFALKWKIRRQSGLLADISPSRLTEEIFKIIHSPNARKIAEELDAMGLYTYLQPNAAEHFKNKPGFKDRYLKTMDSLNGEGFRNLAGEALSALVRDYLDDNINWALMTGSEEAPHAIPQLSQNAEQFKSAFILARKFVLPMNPPRIELYDALRFLFAEHGITVKKARLSERRPRSPRLAAASKPAGTNKLVTAGMPALAAAEKSAVPQQPAPEGAPNNRRRRRRRPKTPASQ